MPYSKYSAKQRRLAAVAPPKKKITSADLAKLKKKEKRKNETYNTPKKQIKRTFCSSYKRSYGLYEKKDA